MNSETLLTNGRFHNGLRIRQLLMYVPAAILLLWTTTCSASIALLVEEPYGSYGAYNPTGHAAIYLDHVCAETPTRLRPCRPGELGVVVSRYLHVHGNDWFAMPLIPYLYAVDDLADVPSSPDAVMVKKVRTAYWSAHLRGLAPPDDDGSAPEGFRRGLWVGLVGASYDRDIHGYRLDTTQEQDLHFIEKFNNRDNITKYNLFAHNCADFANLVLKTYFPMKIRRNFIGDLGVLTPKRVAQAFVKYGNRHNDLHLSPFTIPQVEGRVPRSYSINGVFEAVVKSKRYIVPLVLINPTFAAAAVLGYLAEDHSHLPKETTVMDLRLLADQTTVTLSGSGRGAEPGTSGVVIDSFPIPKCTTEGIVINECPSTSDGLMGI